MSTQGTIDGTAWPEGIVQLLDDHHLVVLADRVDARRRFGGMLASQLSLMSDTDVVDINGREALDLPSFCRQLEDRMPLRKDDLNHWWRDLASVIRVLRDSGGRARRRYFLWRDADA